MSGIYDVTLAAAAGSTSYIPATGNYVKVLTAPSGAVQIKLDGGEGYSLLEGQGFRLPDGADWFRDVQVRNLSGVAQTVTLFVGDSRFEDTRITGNVSIIDQVGVNCRTDNPSSTAIQAFTATALVLPAANLNGLIVRSGRAAAKGGAVGSPAVIYLIAAAAAPTGLVAANQILLLTASDSDSVIQQVSNFDLKKRIPAGWGLYWAVVVSTTIALTCNLIVSYEVL